MTKLRIDVVSDLHLEHYVSTTDFLENILVSPHQDSKKHGVLVLAGDICQINLLPKYKEFFDLMSSLYLMVVVVPGNHEFYQGLGVQQDNESAKKFFSSYPNIKYLPYGDSVIVGQTAFIGATLWTDITECLSDEHFVEITKWPDFRLVKTLGESGSYITQTPFTMADLYQRDLESLITAVKNAYESSAVQNIIPITHFSPVSRVHPAYKDFPKSQFFTNGLERFFMPGGVFNNHKIRHWIYGHTHQTMKFKVYSTQIHCNPAGYPSRRNGFVLENPHFMWQTAFEVNDGRHS